MHLDEIFRIKTANSEEIKSIGTLWERAAMQQSTKGEVTSFTITRKTGGDGTSYPSFSSATVVPQINIFGNSIQDGTPAPDAPVEVESVGEKIYDMDYELYEPVEYIKSDGTQYIDTGLNVTSKIIKVETKYSDLVKRKNAWGFNYLDNYWFNVYHSESGYEGLWCGGNTNIVLWYSDTAAHTVSIETGDSSTLVINVDGETKYDGTYIDSFTSTSHGNFMLFTSGGYNNYNVTARRSTVQMYYFKLYLNNVLVRSFVPAKRLADDIYGMWDEVGQKFYANVGTSNFAGGDPVDKYKIPIAISTNPAFVGLPNEYQQVEYLESSGTQYIDTGVLPSAVNIMKTVVIPLSLSSRQNYIGSYSASSMRTGFGIYPNTGFFATHGDTTYTNHSIAAIIGNKYSIEYDIDIQNGGCSFIIDGVEKSATFTAYDAGNNTLSLFARSTGDMAICQMFSAELWDNTTLIRSFIPARRISDSVLGMYDLVSGTFFTNAGTGTFTAGADIAATITNLYLDAPLRKIGDFEDYIDFKNQTVVRQVIEEVVDGTETINLGGSAYTPTGCKRFYMETSVGKSGTLLSAFCNQYPVVTNRSNIKENTVIYGAANATVNFMVSDEYTAASYKAYLAAQYAAGTPIKVYYPLETRTIETITTPSLAFNEKGYVAMKTATTVTSTVQAEYLGK